MTEFTDEDKAKVTLKANILLLFLVENGFGRNVITKIALKLVARIIDFAPGELTTEMMEKELDFICKDEAVNR